MRTAAAQGRLETVAHILVHVQPWSSCEERYQGVACRLPLYDACPKAGQARPKESLSQHLLEIHVVSRSSLAGNGSGDYRVCKWLGSFKKGSGRLKRWRG